MTVHDEGLNLKMTLHWTQIHPFSHNYCNSECTAKACMRKWPSLNSTHCSPGLATYTKTAKPVGSTLLYRTNAVDSLSTQTSETRHSTPSRKSPLHMCLAHSQLMWLCSLGHTPALDSACMQPTDITQTSRFSHAYLRYGHNRHVARTSFAHRYRWRHMNKRMMFCWWIAWRCWNCRLRCMSW